MHSLLPGMALASPLPGAPGLHHGQGNLMVFHLQGDGQGCVVERVHGLGVRTVDHEDPCSPGSPGARADRRVMQGRLLAAVAGLHIRGCPQQLSHDFHVARARGIVQWRGSTTIPRVHVYPQAQQQPHEAHAADVRRHVQGAVGTGGRQGQPFRHGGRKGQPSQRARPAPGSAAGHSHGSCAAVDACGDNPMLDHAEQKVPVDVD
mmetsp:Transcript_74911/g.242218  ORF Transcript_74911/g.242218 Transcript_74911/m.242218 type:complete len:205 (+) Transcript_74911:138-752(+)